VSFIVFTCQNQIPESAKKLGQENDRLVGKKRSIFSIAVFAGVVTYDPDMLKDCTPLALVCEAAWRTVVAAPRNFHS
jgi:hypothetical protein